MLAPVQATSPLVISTPPVLMSQHPGALPYDYTLNPAIHTAKNHMPDGLIKPKTTASSFPQSVQFQ